MNPNILLKPKKKLQIGNNKEYKVERISNSAIYNKKIMS